MDFDVSFSTISLWMIDIPQTYFEFETDKSSLQVACNNKYLAFKANVDHFREVSNCRLKPFG